MRPTSWFAVLWQQLRRPVLFAVPLLAVVVAIALLGYGSARRDADRYAAAVAGAAGAKVVALAATGANAGMRGSLVVPADGSRPVLDP